MQRRLVYILAVLLAGTGLIFGQATATINGRVVDQGGAVAPGVNVTVTNVGSGAVRQAVTNAEGLYEVASLVSGNYTVKAELKGFAPIERTVELLVGSTNTADLQPCKWAPFRESVSVEAQRLS